MAQFKGVPNVRRRIYIELVFSFSESVRSQGLWMVIMYVCPTIVRFLTDRSCKVPNLTLLEADPNDPF